MDAGQIDAQGEVVAIKRELKWHTFILGSLLGLMWLSFIANSLILDNALLRYGVRPRDLDGLIGLVTAPFLHGTLGHVLSNSLPFLILGWLVLSRSISRFILVSFAGAVIGGLGIWLIGSGDSIHVGASGVVFAYFGYLLLAGWFERSLLSILLSLIVFASYGGLIWGVFPGRLGISWEGHLFGFLSGALVARLTRNWNE